MVLKVSRRSAISPFIALDVLRHANARAAAGGDVLHLEIGQPSTPAPRPVLEAARRALDGQGLGYTEALGIPPLRRRIAELYRERYGLAIDPHRVAISTGSSGAFLLAFLAAFDVGDRVALAAPGYPAYRNILASLGIQPIDLPARAEDRFQPTVELIEGLDHPIDGLIVASPSNPTGTMLSRDELARLCAYCRDRGIRLVSDEIYHGIAYEHDGVTALAFGDDPVVVNSFSKYFSMTGWRLGWMVLPEDLAAAGRMSRSEALHLAADALSDWVRSRFSTAAKSSTATSPAIAAIAICWCADCRRSEFVGSLRRRAPSTSMRMSPASPTTARISAGRCWRKQAWR